MNACDADFPYNTAYSHQLRDVTVTEDNGFLRIAVATLVYDDSACTVKRGLVTENIRVAPQKTLLSGRDNMFKGNGSLTGSSIGADGGIGLTLTQMPDGTLSNIVGNPFIADVENGNLYITAAGGAVPLDGTGYPIQIDIDAYLVR